VEQQLVIRTGGRQTTKLVEHHELVAARLGRKRRPIFAFAGVWRPLGESAAFAFLTCERRRWSPTSTPRPCP